MHRQSIAVLALVICYALRTHAQDSTIIVLDHAAGAFVEVYTSRDGIRETIPARNMSGLGGTAITVRTDNPVRIVLRNFPTALWDASASTKEFDSPDYDLYNGLLDAIKPYAADAPLLLGFTVLDRDGPPELATVKVTAFRDSITSLRSITMWKVRRLSVSEQISADETAAIRRFAASCLGGTSARPRLKFLDSLAAWYDSLGRVKVTKEVTDLREQSKALLTKATQLERALIRLSALDNTTAVKLSARTSWKAGVSATLTIASSEVMGFAGLDTTLSRFSITLLPSPLVRPMSALAVLWWSGEDFQSYTTDRTTSGYAIRASKDDISHFSQGLSFGLAWRFLDFRDVKDKGIALSIPELMVNPFDSFRAIGLGVGASYAFFKISVGALWIRNTALDGQHAGDVLADPALLKIAPAYTPRFFVSLGLYNVSL
jgi:hypothetical protein